MSESSPENGTNWEWSREASTGHLVKHWKHMNESVENIDPEDEAFWQNFENLADFLHQHRKKELKELGYGDLNLVTVTFDHLRHRDKIVRRQREAIAEKSEGRWSFYSGKPVYIPKGQEEVRNNVTKIITPTPIEPPRKPEPPKSKKAERDIVKQKEKSMEKRSKGLLKSVHDQADENNIKLDEYPFIKEMCKQIKEAKSEEDVVTVMNVFLEWVGQNMEESDYGDILCVTEIILQQIGYRLMVDSNQAYTLEESLNVLQSHHSPTGSPDNLD